jgi:hypothetical protein
VTLRTLNPCLLVAASVDFGHPVELPPPSISKDTRTNTQIRTIQVQIQIHNTTRFGDEGGVQDNSATWYDCLFTGYTSEEYRVSQGISSSSYYTVRAFSRRKRSKTRLNFSSALRHAFLPISILPSTKVLAAGAVIKMDPESKEPLYGGNGEQGCSRFQSSRGSWPNRRGAFRCAFVKRDRDAVLDRR